MDTIIGIKQLHKDLSKIASAAQRGRSFTVVKHARPVFRIEPVQQDDEKPFTLADLKKIRFKTNDKNLSKKIDRIVYGT